MSAGVFDGVLDMLAGRYPSDEFAELRPRVTWDRTRNWITPRQGVKKIAILNGGTIPDRGLYGVFLAGRAQGKPVRVGELDEEMVFESRTGDTFVLGASTWRVRRLRMIAYWFRQRQGSGQDAVLAWRPGGAAAGVRAEDRRVGEDAAGDAAKRGGELAGC